MTTVLVVLSSYDRIGTSRYSSGNWLDTFATPYFLLRDAGVRITVVTPAGGPVHFDPRSGRDDSATDAVRRLRVDDEARAAVADTQRLEDVDASVINGDDTYEAAHLPEMIDTLISGPYDHVLGVRQDNQETTSYRPGHEAGNRMFNRLTGSLFGSQVSDMLSGYRVFSRRFVKSFPAISRRFEIETELTVHTMSLRLPTTEVAVDFRDRPDGSESKLSTFKDGSASSGSSPPSSGTNDPACSMAR